MRHVHILADEIGDRQVGTHGLELAVEYVAGQCHDLAAQAAQSRPDLDVEVFVERVSGDMSLEAFGHSFGNAYANVTNVVLKIRPRTENEESAPGVMINSHIDSALGSVGASDAGTCIGVMLEMARTVVHDPDRPPAAPLVFLFNGAEETLMQAAHGFMHRSVHSRDLGAFINLESTGPWGPDVLFQSSRDWTLKAWADIAPYPRGNSVFQDFFDLGLIPADTDYRLFSYRRAGSLPGVDVAEVFDGLAYHTNQDRSWRVRPGTLQSMGENALEGALEFARRIRSGDTPGISSHGGGYVAFDVLGLKMVVYSYSLARALHQAPLAVIVALIVGRMVFLPNTTGRGHSKRSKSSSNKKKGSSLTSIDLATMLDPVLIVEGAARAISSVVLAHALPATLGALRAVATHAPMVWYGRYWAVYATFLPTSMIGLCLPYVFWQRGPAAAWSQSFGSALAYAAVAALLARHGVFAGYGFALWAAATLVSTLVVVLVSGASSLPGISLMLPAGKGRLTITSLLMTIPYVLPVIVAFPVGATALVYIVEKIGLAGAAPGVLGLVVGDIAVGAASAAPVYAALGTLTPHLVAALGRRWGRVSLLTLFCVSVATCGITTAAYQQHPYTVRAPKRVIAQHLHIFEANDCSRIAQSVWAVAGFDGVPVRDAVKGGPIAEHANSIQPFDRSQWQCLYPLDRLLDGFWVPAAGVHLSGGADAVPKLTTVARKPVERSGLVRWELQLDTKRAALGAINATGDITGWSFGKTLAPVISPEGQPSHLTRIAAAEGSSIWDWWVEAREGTSVEVTVSLGYPQADDEQIQALRAAVPPWVSLVTATGYQLRAILA